MSLLTVAQHVAEEVGIKSPSTVIGNTDKDAKRLLRLINRAGERLARKDWTVLQKEYTFATVNGTDYYDLPSDFSRFLDLSLWNRDSYWSLRGPLNARDWQVMKSGLVANVGLRQNFRVRPVTRVRKFYIDPTPSAAEDLVFEYASNAWVKDTGNTQGQTSYAVDTDVSLIDENLIELDCIWRILNRKGFAYAEEKREAENAIDEAYAADRAISTINFGGRASSPVDIGPNITEGNWNV